MQITELIKIYKINNYVYLAVHKGRPKSGGEGVCSVRIRGKGSSSDADVRTFWCKKTPDFSKFMMCPHGQGGWVSANILRTGGGEGQFSRVCTDVSYGRSLTAIKIRQRWS